MDPQTGEDLGHGVHASPGAGGELTVTSPRLDLGWRVAEGRVSGTPVLWGNHSFEVVGRVEIGQGARWTLQRWDEASAMRGVIKLERETVQEMADRAGAEVRGRRTRISTLLLLPLLGLAPARVQKKWTDGWGFDPERATQVSAICEVLVGAVGIIQVATRGFGGEPFMPAWLAYLGVVFFASGVVRLALVAADGEPVGSVVGLPLLLVAPKPRALGPVDAPVVRSFDEAGGHLVLVSPVYRRDWDRDGLLQYRGGFFRLDRVEQEGRSWVYLFTRVDHDGGTERILRLMPPTSSVPPPTAVEPASPSFLRTMLVTAAVTLGSASDQQRWAGELGIRAVWLTVIGAGAELVGGIANLQDDLGSAQSLLILLDFFLVGEGLLRLGSALVGRPMGSVLGWVLGPLYRRHLPPDTSNQ